MRCQMPVSCSVSGPLIQQVRCFSSCYALIRLLPPCFVFKLYLFQLNRDCQGRSHDFPPKPFAFLVELAGLLAFPFSLPLSPTKTTENERIEIVSALVWVGALQ
jgi:hypothetical protein